MTDAARVRWLEGAAADGGTTLPSLGLAAGADDAPLSRALAARVAATPLVLSEPKPVAPSSPEEGPTAAKSVFGRVADLSDARTLELVVRGGPLSARRLALLRIAKLLDEERLEPETVAHLDAFFSTVRDLDVAAACSVARRKLPGAAGREARAEDDAARAVTARLCEGVRAFWEGESSEEPLALLDPEARALALTRLGVAPDLVVAHIASLLDGSAPGAEAALRLETLGTLRHAGDPRLCATLAALLFSPRSDLVLEAGRGLSRIDDPRVRPLLWRALSSAAAPHERAVLAGALGRAGDPRGVIWARRLLSASDAAARRAALEAMTVLAESADVDALAAIARETDLPTTRLCIAALGRTGDARALAVLSRIRARGVATLEADLEDAESVLTAQIELRGEAVPERGPGGAIATQGRAAIRGATPGLWQRALGSLEWALGAVSTWVGARARAISHFQRAASRVPGWASPLVALADALLSTGDTASALAASRRAIEADRRWVEAHARAVGLVSRVFLRRAEETARGGLRDVARGLLEEVLALDLRRAPSALRFELERRLSTLAEDASATAAP